MALHISMSIHATLQCLQCKQSITGAESLIDGKCSCGALLITVDATINNSKSDAKDADADILDDNNSALDEIAFSDDEEFFTASDPIDVEHDKIVGSTDLPARLKRTQTKLSDDSSDNERSVASIKKMKQEPTSLDEAFMKQNHTSNSSHLDSNDQSSNSEDELVSTSSDDAKKVKLEEDNQQALQPSFTRFANEIKGEPLEEPTRMTKETWNKTNREQNTTQKSNTNSSPRVRKKKYPSGNGFALFNSEQFRLVQNEHNIKGGVTCVAAIVGKRWKELDPETRSAYHQRARKIREDWKLKHPDEYRTSLMASIAKRNQTQMARNKTKL